MVKFGRLFVVISGGCLSILALRMLNGQWEGVTNYVGAAGIAHVLAGLFAVLLNTNDENPELGRLINIGCYVTGLGFGAYLYFG